MSSTQPLYGSVLFHGTLFRLARKSKQSGLSKSEKSLAKRNGNLNLSQAGSYACRHALPRPRFSLGYNDAIDL